MVVVERGEGYAVALKNKGHKVTAIDLSKNQIDISNLVWESKEINFKCQSILEMKSGHFDFVISSQVIEYTQNPSSTYQKLIEY